MYVVESSRNPLSPGPSTDFHPLQNDCIVSFASHPQNIHLETRNRLITFVLMAPRNVDDVVALEVCQHRAPLCSSGVHQIPMLGLDGRQADTEEGDSMANQSRQIPPAIE